ncbi:MAG: hypothetical protein NW205_08940 [Hyphomicrobiaceae bacterium]|nr:hypothetical protein [Hyphomicrobiaceae bacterium]
MSTSSLGTARDRRAGRGGIDLALHLARRPGFCCCCLCLSRQDARRFKRVARLVRAVQRSWSVPPTAVAPTKPRTDDQIS